MTPQEAARAARIEFGNAAAHREECRAALGYRLWDELRSDLRFAARSLRNQPGYSAAAIAILALAIGVNSAFFTLFSQHVLKPLPIRGAERHFDIEGLDGRGQSTGNWTAAEIEDLRQAGRQHIEGLYTSRTIQVLLIEPQQRLGVVSFVSGSYFQLLGGSAAAGRAFAAAERREPVAVLSRSGQRRLFRDDPAPLGKKLRVRTTILTIIGVMPPEFTGAQSVVPDFWVGSELDSALLGRDGTAEPRYNVSGLLSPGVSPAQAEPSLTGTAARFWRPEGEPVARVKLQSRSGFMAANAELLTAAALVFAAFLMVLAIACANLANLCLSRAASRTHEIAMRLSLGASRSRIVRQLLTESTFIALAGAAAGLAAGVLAVELAERYLVTFAGGMGISIHPVDPDWRVFLFSGGLGVIAGLAFGLLPAIEVTSPSLTISAKRDHAPFAGRVRPRRLRNTLIAAQVASSLVLLIVAGILVQRIQSLNATSPGYDLDRIFDLKLDDPHPELLTRLDEHPSVAAVSAVERVPLYGALPQRSATAGGSAVRLSYNHVDHRFFETLALPVDGRGFTAQEAATNAKVVVISQATARRLWPAATPFGQSITIDEPQAQGANRPSPVTDAEQGKRSEGKTKTPQPGDPGGRQGPKQQNAPPPSGNEQPAGTYQVVGVVPDVISGWLFRGKDATAVYFPAAAGQDKIQSAIVRIDGQPAPATAAIRELCAGAPGQTLPGHASAAVATGCEPTSLREVSGLWGLLFEAAAAVAGALGMLALLLTAVGIYGVISYSVVQRRREIGVLLALGATPTQVVTRMLRETWRCVAAGLAVGLPICLILSRLLSSSVFGINAFDPGVYLAVPATLALITTLASALPARRAAKMDPMEALREE
jgi:predicted permease